MAKHGERSDASSFKLLIHSCQGLPKPRFRVGRYIISRHFYEGKPVFNLSKTVEAWPDIYSPDSLTARPWNICKRKGPACLPGCIHFLGVNSLVNFGWFTQGCDGCFMVLQPFYSWGWLNRQRLGGDPLKQMVHNRSRGLVVFLDEGDDYLYLVATFMDVI